MKLLFPFVFLRGVCKRIKLDLYLQKWITAGERYGRGLSNARPGASCAADSPLSAMKPSTWHEGYPWLSSRMHRCTTSSDSWELANHATHPHSVSFFQYDEVLKIETSLFENACSP